MHAYIEWGWVELRRHAAASPSRFFFRARCEFAARPFAATGRKTKNFPPRPNSHPHKPPKPQPPNPPKPKTQAAQSTTDAADAEDPASPEAKPLAFDVDTNSHWLAQFVGIKPASVASATRVCFNMKSTRACNPLASKCCAAGSKTKNADAIAAFEIKPGAFLCVGARSLGMNQGVCSTYETHTINNNTTTQPPSPQQRPTRSRA